MTLPRKRRQNHNEIEKKRRDQHRTRLEELRECIPSLVADRASAVTIVTEAAAHIRHLTRRNQQLKVFIRESGLKVPTELQEVAVAPSTSGPGLYISAPAEPHTMPGDALINFLHMNNSTSTSGSPLKRQSRDEQDSFDPVRQYSTLLPRKGSISRRDSAMLLPTNDPNTFLFGRRDSIQNFFSGPLPEMFEDGPRSQIHCTKCARGVDNLIMIDCDNCHNWYHIGCVKIDANQIPLAWRCPECGETRSRALN